MKVYYNTYRGREQYFCGFKVTKDESGFKNYEFSYPYDSNRQNVSIEFYKLGKDSNNNYYTRGILRDSDGKSRFDISKGINSFDISTKFGIDDNEPFGYNYHISTNGKNSDVVYLDAGDSIPISGKHESVNIILPNGSNVSKGGAMKLVIPDSHNVGVVYNSDGSYKTDKTLKTKSQSDIKTLWNKMGGTLAGLEKSVDDGKFNQYSRIVGLPLFGRDRLSAHQYWLEEMFQISPSLGNINNYASLQRKLFAHDINWVADGAFVNEGLQGAHFSHMLKFGMESPFYRWFRAGSRQNGPWSLGNFPKDTRYISHKVINHPYNFKQMRYGKIVPISKNQYYDPTQPTKIQYFDKRYVTSADINNPQLIIKNYNKSSMDDNPYKLNTHNDSMFLLCEEIDPDDYTKNIEKLNEYNSSHPKSKQINLTDYEGTRFVSKFPNWYVSGKHESGFETWDANPDIAKLNFVQSHTDTMALKNMNKFDRERELKKLSVANAQVQDYAVEVGRYWTKTTDDILRLYIAQQLKNVDANNPKKVYQDILSKADGKRLPISLSKYNTQLSENEVSNVLKGEYFNKRKLSYEDKNSQILEGLMNYPLEAIEFENNLVSAFASPMISKRASTLEEIQKTRYELYKEGNPNLADEYKKTYLKMQDIYINQMSTFAIKVLDTVNNSLPENSKLFNGDDVTEFGQYTLPMILPQIAKYAIIKSLAPEIKTSIDDNGEIRYDYDALGKVSTQKIGASYATSPQDEAEILLDKLQEGMDKLTDDNVKFFADSLKKTLNNTNADSFKLADLIIDKTQSGLDWRIDATKDIADKEAMLSGYMNFESTWQEVIDFWKRFATGVYGENRNSYMVAEITDEVDLWNKGWGSRSDKFPNVNDINQKFIRETGMSSIADYSNYFYNIVQLFSRSFENGSINSENPNKLAEKLVSILMNNKGSGLLKNNSLPSIMYSYTFFSNHDKPRPIHCAALDMDMLYSDLTYDTDTHRKNAYRPVNDRWFGDISDEEVSKYNFNSVSPKAAAMAIHLDKAFNDALNDLKPQIGDRFDNNFKAINRAIRDLSIGSYNGERFEADAFGVKPFDVNIEMVLRQAKKRHNLDIDDKTMKELKDLTFEYSVKHAMDKVLAMTKVLVALPGMPTLFDGDDYGATGYETKMKNVYNQCRQKVHEEWADPESPEYKKFIADYKQKFDDAMKIRRKPECNALNNGAPYVLPMQNGWSDNGYNGKLPAILQHSTDGRMTISIINLHKKSDSENRKPFDNESKYEPLPMKLGALQLNFENSNDIKDGAYGVGIPGIEEGTKFQNANDPNDYYTVNECDGKYVLKHDTDGGIINVNDTTLVLYHVPNYMKNLPFTGKITPDTKFVEQAYLSNM